jgi:membrane fusion protein
LAKDKVLMPITPLFRKEALASRQVNWRGEIMLIRPVSFFVLTLMAVLSAVLVILFFIYGSYTLATVCGHGAGDQRVVQAFL